MIKKISYEHCVYESVDDNSLSKAISQKTDEKNKSCNKGLMVAVITCLFKSGKVNCFESYRAISILVAYSKILEKIVTVQ